MSANFRCVNDNIVEINIVNILSVIEACNLRITEVVQSVECVTIVDINNQYGLKMDRVK